MFISLQREEGWIYHSMLNLFILYFTHFSLQRTVVAVLDCLIDPQWSCLPLGSIHYKHGKEKSQELRNIPSRYRLNFRLIDGDFNGRKYVLGKKGDQNFLKDEHYQLQQSSCLRALCFSSENGVSILTIISYSLIFQVDNHFAIANGVIGHW